MLSDSIFYKEDSSVFGCKWTINRKEGITKILSNKSKVKKVEY